MMKNLNIGIVIVAISLMLASAEIAQSKTVLKQEGISLLHIHRPLRRSKTPRLNGSD